MKMATVTSKGQVTIPKDVRDAAGIREHDRVVFVVQGSVILMRVVRKSEPGELLGALRSDVPYPGREAEREAARQYVARRVMGLGVDDDSPDAAATGG
jgi:antitoxin PrlF